MRTFKPIKRELSSLENTTRLPPPLCKFLTPKTCPNDKENRNLHTRIISPYTTDQDHTTSFVEQTFDFHHDRVLTTRPTMGGKTIEAINSKAPTRMSPEELKLLDRRINPQEPLSSRHQSPSKPPLPITIKKRKRKQQDVDIIERPNKILKTFTCQPCNKNYKTRSGYLYHTERCQFLKKPVVIKCICSQETKDADTLIECTLCNTWLHVACLDTVLDDTIYCCPRCMAVTKETEPPVDLPQETEFDFMSLLNEPPVVPSSPTLPYWTTEDEWSTQDVPSLLYSDPLDDLPSSDLSQSDWLHFANFDVDFHDL